MYPSVYFVGKYVEHSEFLKQRIQVAGWVHNQKFVDMVLAGRYNEIFPIHIEVCTTYACNFDCPWCNCGLSMQKYPSVMSIDTIMKIVQDCASHEIGIQWTGGEPLTNPATICGVQFASDLSVNQCLFTNGSLLNMNNIDKLLITNLKFIRISMNVSNIDAHVRFHGNIKKELSQNVFNNIELLCARKKQLVSKVKIGLSIVLDSSNIEYFDESIRFIVSVAKRYPKAIDYVVVRAVNDDFKGIKYIKNADFKSRYHKIISNAYDSVLSEESIELILPHEERIDYLIEGKNLGCQTFSEIAPDGSIFMCSDKYGDHSYKIGSIQKNSIDDILRSDMRKEQIDLHKYCFREGQCPRHSRGWYFNMLFDQIEKYRANGKMNVVGAWIHSLQNYVPNEGHSFFI